MSIKSITEQEFISICKERYRVNQNTRNRLKAKDINLVAAQIEILNDLRLHLRQVLDVSIDQYQYSEFESGTRGELSAIGHAILKMLQDRKVEDFDANKVINNEMLVPMEKEVMQ
jgi:hypothetical protein